MEKSQRAERDYLVALLKLAGEPIDVTAARFGVSVPNARNIAKSNAWMVEKRAGRGVPPGLTTRAAIAIEEALGIWPTDADKQLVESNAMTMLRSENGRRVVMSDIGTWLGLKSPS